MLPNPLPQIRSHSDIKHSLFPTGEHVYEKLLIHGFILEGLRNMHKITRCAHPFGASLRLFNAFQAFVPP